jgi:chromosome segregation ATPase
MEGVKEDLIKQNEKSDKNINSYERKIDRAKKDIEDNDMAQSKRREEIINQKEVLRSVTPKTETYETEDKKLNGLEKELRKLQKAGENLHKDIDGWNADIRREKRNIESTDDRIKGQKDAISKQKDHVQEVRSKMENIK